MAALVRILTTPDVTEGAIVRSRLEDEGIPVMTNGGEGPYRMGPVHVLVPAEFEVQARLVLDTIRAGGEVPTEAGTEEPEREERS